MREDEMVRWHHRLIGHEFEQALGVGDEQGGLVCCGSWGRKELATTEQLHFHFSLSCIREGNGNPFQLPGESQGWGSLGGCRLWGRTESEPTEAT